MQKAHFGIFPIIYVHLTNPIKHKLTKETRNFSFWVYLKQDQAQIGKGTQKPMQPDLQILHSK